MLLICLGGLQMIILISMLSLEHKQEVEQVMEPRFVVVVVVNITLTAVGMAMVVVNPQQMAQIPLVYMAGLVVVVFLPMVNRV